MALRMLSLVIAWLPIGAVSAATADDLVAFLGDQMASTRIRGEDRRIAIEKVDVSALEGVTRWTLLGSLGIPDNCSRDAIKECAAQTFWVYRFYYIPPGSVGGGPELWLEFDVNDQVHATAWQVSR